MNNWAEIKKWIESLGGKYLDNNHFVISKNKGNILLRQAGIDTPKFGYEVKIPCEFPKTKVWLKHPVRRDEGEGWVLHVWQSN
jgi:hypothetical protein